MGRPEELFWQYGCNTMKLMNEDPGRMIRVLSVFSLRNVELCDNFPGGLPSSEIG